MNIHIKNIGECQKCGLTLTSFLSSLSQFGIKNIFLTDKASECDLLIIVGCLSKTQQQSLMDFWKKMPQNSRIFNFGDCGTEVQDLFNFKNQNLKNQAIPKDDLSEILPIDYILEGCPPTLEALTVKFKEIN